MSKLAMLTALWIAGSVTAFGQDVAVVVRAEIPTSDISFEDVRKIFLGSRQFWSSNVRVTVLIPAPGSRERAVVVKTICQMTEAQFLQHWISKVFRADSATAPKVVYSPQTALAIVSAVPGAIVLLDAPQVPKELKILRVDGRLPGDKDYKLR